MPRGKRQARGNGGTGTCATRASASFPEEQVEAMLKLFARMDTAPPSARAHLGIGDSVNKVRAKFIAMRGSITAAKAAKRATEGVSHEGS